MWNFLASLQSSQFHHGYECLLNRIEKKISKIYSGYVGLFAKINYFQSNYYVNSPFFDRKSPLPLE